MNDKTSPIATHAPTPDIPRVSFILLSFDPTNRVVTAQLEPNALATTASIDSLREDLQDAGYGEFYAAVEVLNPVILAANKGQAGNFIIAEQRDAQLTLTVSPDKLAVHAQLTKAYGGRTISREWLDAELKALGVASRCILNSAVEALLAAGEAQNSLLARAIMPEKGVDAYLDILVDGCKNLALQEDEQGRVDFYQSHEFVVVDIGDHLVRRIAPTAGKMGLNVAGIVLAPEAGKDITFGSDHVGAAVATKDPNLLVATVKGHPVIRASGVSVDPILRLKNVNLATGNISFDGSVEIAGDVASGLSVQATGDIFIRGMVEKARVSARRNLVIQGGVMGDDLGRDDRDELILRTRLRAGGNISAKFMNFVDAVAGQGISVREYVMQSHLQAQELIAIGQEGGKGSLIGGRAKAGVQFAANIIGSEAYVATDVRVGKDNLKRYWLERLKQAYMQTQHNCSQLRQLLEVSNGSLSAEKHAQVEHTLNAQIARQARIRSIVGRLLARTKSSFQHQIIVKRSLHANVTLTIDGVTHVNELDAGPRCLVRKGAELIIKD